MSASLRAGGWRSVVAGTVILISLTVVSTFVFFLDSIRRSLLEGPHIVVLAEEARGLSPGADVWVAGSPAGRVTSLVFGDPTGPEERRVVIRATLYRTVVPYLREGVRARIAAASLLAPVVLKLTPGDRSGGAFDFGDTLYVARDTTAQVFLTLAGSGRAEVDSLHHLLASLDARVTRGPGSVAAIRSDSVLRNRFPMVAAGAREIVTALRSDTAFPARWASDSIGAALGRVTEGIMALGAEGRVSGVVDSVVALANALENVSARLARMDADLRLGEGTAGRALYDDEIARQEHLLRARVDSARVELMRDPWRWLRFRLF